MSLTGLVLLFSYRLQRHISFGWPLASWLGLALLAAAGWALYRWWPLAWQAVLLFAIFLSYLLILIWAARTGYVRFAPGPPLDGLSNAEDSPASPTDLPRLRSEELIPVRASGRFTVMDQDRYLVDVEAAYETVATREHIVIGRIQPTRFLLFGRSRERDTGWWYVFFQPSTIEEICSGHLTFGLRTHLALRVLYAPDANSCQELYLAFRDPAALRRVWDDLLLDAAE